MPLDIPCEVGKGATFNEPLRTHRWNLWRIWEANAPLVVFILLNPSKADEKEDDMTVTKTCGFARRNGFGGVIMVNLHGLISKDPDIMFNHPDRIGQDNDKAVYRAVFHPNVEKIVLAWTGDKRAGARQETFLRGVLSGLGPKLYCLGKTKSGHPRHPSRLGYAAELVPYFTT